LNTAFIHQWDIAALREQFRELSLVENDLKRDFAWAQQNLEGVREIKKEIQQQIFTSEALYREASTQ
jgi:hypothetical protein